MEDSNSRQPKVFLKIVDRPNDAIQKLFSHDNNKSTRPLECRNLPKSFFTPPQDENSAIFHRKSNSSPSSMSKALCQSLNMVEHIRQRSLDTCQNSMHLIRQPYISSELNSIGLTSLTSPIGPLPDYFEMTINENCQVYFLNHRDGETTWFDPRLPAEDQTYGMTLAELDKLHANFARKQGLETSNTEASRRTAPLSPSIIGQGCDQLSSRPIASGCQRVDRSNCSSIACSLGFHANNNVRPSSVPRLQQLVPNSGTGHVQTTKFSQHSPAGFLPSQGDQILVNSHITHAKSSSQPVPMPIGNLTDHPDYYSGECLHSQGWNHGLTLSTSMSGIFDDFSHPSASSLTNSSSGHLAEHLEDLNLATNYPSMQSRRNCSQSAQQILSEDIGPLTAPESCISNIQLRQKHQQYQNMFCASQNIISGKDVKLASTGDHSHQSSMDSGVGKSIAGQSISNSSQQQLQLKDMFCNSNMENCNMDPEMVDSLPYLSSWCNQINFYMADQATAAMEAGNDIQRTQQS